MWGFLAWLLPVLGIFEIPAYGKEPALPVTRVCVDEHHCVLAELAVTPAERARGLMFRDRLDADRGMLFVFPRLDFWSFWMKNTKIPLDMIWLNERREVVSMATRVPPCTTPHCPTYPPLQKALYVLEIQAGLAEKWGLKAGDVLQFELPEEVRKRLRSGE